MLEKILYDQYKTYSYEELKEITVANGYTEEAEKIAGQLLSEKETGYSEDMKAQKKNRAQEDTIQVCCKKSNNKKIKRQVDFYK